MVSLAYTKSRTGLSFGLRTSVSSSYITLDISKEARLLFSVKFFSIGFDFDDNTPTALTE